MSERSRRRPRREELGLHERVIRRSCPPYEAALRGPRLEEVSDLSVAGVHENVGDSEQDAENVGVVSDAVFIASDSGGQK